VTSGRVRPVSGTVLSFAGGIRSNRGKLVRNGPGSPGQLIIPRLGNPVDFGWGTMFLARIEGTGFGGGCRLDTVLEVRRPVPALTGNDNPLILEEFPSPFGHVRKGSPATSSGTTRTLRTN
jgi:hypothetical protein